MEMPVERIDTLKLFRELTPITEALNAGVREAVRRHKQLGLPLVVWRDGKVVLIDPPEVPDPLASPPPSSP